MAQVMNMFREISMVHVKGYKELTEAQKDIFDITFKNQLSSLHPDIRVYYTEKHLQEIKPISDKLKVSFDNGDSFLYVEKGKWEVLSLC